MTLNADDASVWRRRRRENLGDLPGPEMYCKIQTAGFLLSLHMIQ